MKPFIDILIPTYDNNQQLMSCLQSIYMSMYGSLANLIRVIVINNGHDKLPIEQRPNLKILEVGKNLGWEGGLKLGLQESNSPYVIFSNDDVRLLQGAKDWLWKLGSIFNDPSVGAVGPASNFVMGQQNIFADNAEIAISTKFLIGFFVMLRREALVKAGGIDDTLPGGDDIDLSIRLRDQGYKLVCRRDIFVYHHGQQTGTRVFEGYWNSPQMQEKTNMALIQKHGMLKFWETMIMGPHKGETYFNPGFSDGDVEGDLCRQFIRGDKVLELGCGGKKTVPHAVGIDLFPAGEHIPFVAQGTDSCVSDIQADATMELPVPAASQDTIVARHFLEHCQDTIGTLSMWNRALKIGGRLVVAVPNNSLGNTIMMNPEHMVSFVPTSLEKLASAAGFKKIFTEEKVNGVSFVMVFEKEYVPVFGKPKKTVAPLAAQLMEVV